MSSSDETDDNLITADARMLAGVTVLIGQLMHEKGAMEEKAHRLETMLDEIDVSLGTGFHTSRLDKIAEYRTKNAELATQLVTERNASKTYQSAHARLTEALDWPEASSPVETVDYVVRSLRGLRMTLGLVEDATLGKICEAVEALRKEPG